MANAIEDSLKSVFNQWLEEAMPVIEARVKNEITQDIDIKSHQTLFNQQEMARRQNVSVTTFVKWRKMGLQAEPSPTGKLLFDLDKVNQWREENGIRKVN